MLRTTGALSAFLFCATVNAQITGELRGSVTDATGSAITSAKITLKSAGTGQSRAQATNGKGEFAFNLLQVGDYEVRAEAAGFNSAQTKVQVKAGETSVVTLKLEIGQTSTSVDVVDAVTQLDTENAQLQNSVTGTAVQEIPVGRNPNAFALLSPGVAPVSANNPFLGSGSFNSNGGRGRGNNITVDGITATDVSVTGTGGPLGPLNFESIKEVKVITNNFDAQYGRNSSSQVLYITKGGTNALHGVAYEYFQNDKLNARSFFDKTGKASILRNNTYGFEVGGPVFIPKVFDGRNHLFFHVDYEGNKQRGAGQAQIAFVPTPAQLASVTNPTSLAIVKQYQLPSSPSGTLQESAPSTANTYQVSYRGDVVIGTKDTLWARYGVFDSVQSSSGLTFITSSLPYFGASSTNHPRQATLSETHLFGAIAVNEFRFGFGQSKPNFPIQTPYPLGPQINFSDGSVTSIGVSSILPQGREQRTYQYTDNFSVTLGTHNVKFGGEYYNLNADSVFDNNVRSTLSFNSFADFAAGIPVSYSQNFGNSARSNVVHNAFGFAQDDWKVTRKLTLNLGVRYEWAGGPTEANGKISNLDLRNTSAYGAAGAGPLGLLKTGQPSFNSNNNWAPRVGFAWSPMDDGKTIVRGGYGIAYDFIYLNPITNQRFLPPFIYATSLSGTGNFTGNNSYSNVFGGTSAIQKQTAASVGSLSTTALNFGNISPAIAQNLRNPQVQQWNLGIQRELMYGVVFKATYVGTKGTFLTRTRPINLIANPVAPATSVADETARLPQFTSAFSGLNGNAAIYSNRLDRRYNTVNYLESSANSAYHGLQIELQKRLKQGLFFNFAYTWGRSIDDNSDALGVLINDTSAQQNPNDNRNNRSDSQFDLRHVLVVSHTYELPFFRTSSHRVVKGLLGGWSFAGISSYRTGFPVNVFAGPRLGISDSIAVLGGAAVDRPNVAGQITSFNPQPAGSPGNPASLGQTTVNGVKVSTFAANLGLSQPLLGNFGTLGRNALRLNGQTNFDWNVYKNFRFSEKVNMQLRAELYNTFNSVAFQGFASSSITSVNFGVYNTLSQNPRLMQLAARFVF
jgi:outer membrane receptor protein involved in Fe transport